MSEEFSSATQLPFSDQSLPPFNYERGKLRVNRLLRACANAQNLVILTHNDPDPDALASAWALERLLHEVGSQSSQLVYGGIIGRAENRAFAATLGIQLKHVDKIDWSGVDGVVLIDTQIGASNHALPSHIPVVAVLDHHQFRSSSKRASYTDRRPNYGATSTILTEYLVAANVRPDDCLATALFYGIKTDTRGLARDASDCDAWAYMVLLPLVDRSKLARIEQARVPHSYFRTFSDTLARTVLYGNVALANLGAMERPDMAAEMADILMRLDDVDWIICWGRFNNHVVIAVRTQLPNANAARLVREVVGEMGGAGGHAHMAGGRIPLNGDAERVEEELRKRFLRALNATSASAQPLLNEKL